MFRLINGGDPYRSSGSGSLSVAMIGTRGVPARYGGFETCIEEVGRRLVDRGHRLVVYCRGSGEGPKKSPEPEYLGMELVHRPALRWRSLETLSHTGLSVAHLLRHRTDVAIVFNAANAPFLPLIRVAGIPVATHVDGLEWQRTKWSGLGQRYYRVTERVAVWWSDQLIADAPGITEHYHRSFGVDTVPIAYGAPITDGNTDRLVEMGLTADGYHLVVARFEPENHVDLIVRGYVRSGAKLPLIVVGGAPYSDHYTAAVRTAGDNRVRFLGGVWDQGLLDQLYAGARTYLHGHSVGGTNPSLLRAMGAGASVAAYDVVFNRDVLQGAGAYFSNEEGVMNRVHEAERDTAACRARGRSARIRARDYNWDDVTDRYEALCRHLANTSAAVVDRAWTGPWSSR